MIRLTWYVQPECRSQVESYELGDGLHKCGRQVSLLPVSDRQRAAGNVNALVRDIEVLAEDAPVALCHIFSRLLAPVLLDEILRVETVISFREALALAVALSVLFRLFQALQNWQTGLRTYFRFPIPKKGETMELHMYMTGSKCQRVFAAPPDKFPEAAKAATVQRRPESLQN